MQDRRRKRSEARLPADERAVTSAEYGLWRSHPELAWALRHGKIERPKPDHWSLLARLGNEVISNRVASYLRARETVTGVFGRPGACTLLHRFLVEGHWEVRADAVFWPDDGSPVTVVQVLDTVAAEGNSELAVDECALYHLAYQRVALRHCGIEVAACGVLQLAQSGDPARDGAFAFEYRAVTEQIDVVDYETGRSIGDAVALEAMAVRQYLQSSRMFDEGADLRAAPHYRATHRANGSVPQRDEVSAMLHALGIREPAIGEPAA